MDNVGDIHVFEDNIQLSDLLRDGAVFSFESDPTAVIDEECYENDLFEVGCDKETAFVELGAPGQYTFKEIALKMQDVTEDGFIKKLVIKHGSGEKINEGALVEIHYSAFWEGENISFDSTYLRGETKKLTIGDREVLAGIEEATKTMVQGEQAQFLISYQLLFGERGCMPRIKPKADALVNIEVMRVITGHHITKLDKDKQEQESFENIMSCAKSLHTSAKEAVNRNINRAIKLFFNAVKLLETARFSCKDEEQEQQKLLILLYTNLAVCYNKLQNPKKAITMCQAISKISNIGNHCKALYQNALAMEKLGDFRSARELFEKALKLRPTNIEIGQKLADLEVSIEKQVIVEREMCSKMLKLQVMPQIEHKAIVVSQEFQEEVADIIERFSKANMKVLGLPSTMSPIEIEYMQDMLQKNDMVLLQSADNFYIKKL